MTSDELYDLFRKDVVDTVTPYLWSDSEVYAYMNDAYTMFVRLTGGIQDFLTDDVCLVTAATGEAYSAIHPSILFVRQATIDATGETVRVINAQDMERLNDEDFGMLRRLNQSDSVGKVKYMVVGIQPDTVRWVNIPDSDYDIRLLVERLPTTTITGSGQTFDGVKDHHHLHLLKWMRHLAYNKQDAETFNKLRSDAERLEFDAYCALAKREKEKQKHKVRVVAYGGI